MDIYEDRSGVFSMSYSPGPKSNVTNRSTSFDQAVEWAKNILRQYKDFVPAPRMKATSQSIMSELKRRGGRTSIDPNHANVADELVRLGLVTVQGSVMAFTPKGEQVAKWNF